MPVLEPNPPQSRKRLLVILGLMLAIPAFVAIIASIAATYG